MSKLPGKRRAIYQAAGIAMTVLGALHAFQILFAAIVEPRPEPPPVYAVIFGLSITIGIVWLLIWLGAGVRRGAHIAPAAALLCFLLVSWIMVSCVALATGARPATLAFAVVLAIYGAWGIVTIILVLAAWVLGRAGENGA